MPNKKSTFTDLVERIEQTEEYKIDDRWYPFIKLVLLILNKRQQSDTNSTVEELGTRLEKEIQQCEDDFGQLQLKRQRKLTLAFTKRPEVTSIVKEMDNFKTIVDEIKGEKFPPNESTNHPAGLSALLWKLLNCSSSDHLRIVHETDVSLSLQMLRKFDPDQNLKEMDFYLSNARIHHYLTLVLQTQLFETQPQLGLMPSTLSTNYQKEIGSVDRYLESSHTVNWEKREIGLTVLDRTLKQLNDNGKAVCLIRSIGLSSNSFEASLMRKELVQTKWIQAVIQFTTEDIPESNKDHCIVIIDKSKSHKELLLIDIRNEKLTAETISTVAHIIDERTEKINVARLVEINEMREHYYSLLPSQYIQYELFPQLLPFENQHSNYTDALFDFAEAYQQFQTAISEFPKTRNQNLPSITVEW